MASQTLNIFKRLAMDAALSQQGLYSGDLGITAITQSPTGQIIVTCVKAVSPAVTKTSVSIHPTTGKRTAS